jgi:hypothetical protein
MKFVCRIKITQEEEEDNEEENQEEENTFKKMARLSMPSQKLFTLLLLIKIRL